MASPGPLASQFTPDEVDALIVTAADLWRVVDDGADPDEILSARQKELAERALELTDERMEG